MEPSHVLLGKRITAARQRRGWSRSDLARRAEVDPSYVTRIEEGAYKRPSIEKVRALAGALGVSMIVLTDPPPLNDEDDDAHLRRLIEREVGDVATAEELATCIKLMRGKRGADLERALHVFGVLLRSYPPADRNV